MGETLELLKKPNFQNYQTQAQKYINRPVFEGTEMTGELLRKAAEEAYNKYGILVPVDLALAQAQFESSMGRKGRSPKTNPYNVYEYDEGTQKTYETPEQGVDAYYDLMARRYLGEKEVTDLLNNFVNDEGNRYASDPDYEDKLRKQIEFINKFLESNNGTK